MDVNIVDPSAPVKRGTHPPTGPLNNRYFMTTASHSSLFIDSLTARSCATVCYRVESIVLYLTYMPKSIILHV